MVGLGTECSKERTLTTAEQQCEVNVCEDGYQQQAYNNMHCTHTINYGQVGNVLAMMIVQY